MNYKMYIITNSGEIEIPVLPDKIKIKSPGTNEKLTVLGLGEINRLRMRGLREISWSSFLPANSAPYTSPESSKPITIVRQIQKVRDRRKPVRLLLLGGELDINMRVGIESFDYEERGGEVGDIYYTIKLAEWIDYSPHTVMVSDSGDITVIGSDRGGHEDIPTVCTVTEGDTLWNIAASIYGDGTRYINIYEANKSLIDGKNAAEGGLRYDIYNGQELILP